MVRFLFVLALFAAPAASAQEWKDIDLDAVEKMVLACKATTQEKELAGRLDRYGVAEAPDQLDESVGLPVSKAIEPANNPEVAAEILAALIEANADDPRYRLAAAYYMFKDMALYSAASCKAVGRELRRILVFDDMLKYAEDGDEMVNYYRGSANGSRRRLIVRLRAYDRIAEKEAVLLEVLGLEKG